MEKTVLHIKTYGNPALRKKSAAIKEVTQQHRDTLSSMSRMMYEGGGIGLAAPQVGISLAMIVVDIGEGLYKIINPKIVKRSGTQALEEGCLSVPGVCIKVKRAMKVKVAGLDQDGQPQSVEAQGLLACVFQHEIDHLKGRLIVDYATLLDRIKIRRRLEALARKATHEGLSESESKSCKLQL